MPIIDKEVISEVNGEVIEPISVPISELFEQTIRRNIDKYGDSVWMVRYTLFEIYHCTKQRCLDL